MATIPKQAILVVETLHGGPPKVQKFKEKATQTFKKGELVKFNGGYIDVTGADPASVLGVAAEDAHNGAADGDKECAIYLLEGNLFEANLGVSQTTAQTQVGVKYGVVVASNKWHVDNTETTATVFVVVRLSDKDAVGDTNGRVIVKGLNSVNPLA